MSSGIPTARGATARVVAVVALLFAVAAALRGYLPGVAGAHRDGPPRSGASLAYVLALLAASSAIVGMAALARRIDPRRRPASASPLSDRVARNRGRPDWRVVLIGAAVLAAWLLTMWLLSRHAGTHQLEQPRSTPQPGVPPPPGPAKHRPDVSERADDADMLHYLTASTVGLVAIVAVGAMATRRRRTVEPLDAAAPAVGQTAPVAAALLRAAESGLSEVEDAEHQPRQAIIACYAAMERELQLLPGAIPQDFDTPTEVLARAVQHRALRPENAEELLDLFAQARFSPHVMTESHRSRAIEVLQLALSDMGD